MEKRMKGFFSYDGYLIRILTKVMYVVAVNLLFMLCSIPVITAGASAAAMYTVLLRFRKNDEVNILSTFFRAFKDNFKPATLIWIGMAVIGGTLALNYYYLYRSNMSGGDAIRAVFNIVLLLLAILWIYVFPSVAYFKNTVRGYMKFSAGIALAKLPWTIALCFIHAVPILAFLFMAQFSSIGIILLLCCGFSLSAYISAGIFVRMFSRFEDQSDDETIEE